MGLWANCPELFFTAIKCPGTVFGGYLESSERNFLGRGGGNFSCGNRLHWYWQPKNEWTK